MGCRGEVQEDLPELSGGVGPTYDSVFGVQVYLAADRDHGPRERRSVAVAVDGWTAGRADKRLHGNSSVVVATGVVSQRSARLFG